MKRLFFFVMAVLITFTSYAADSYRLPFVELQNGTTKIPFVEQEWVPGPARADWQLYLEKGMLEKKQDGYEFHAATVFKKPFYNDAIKSEVSKIYTYGVLNCNEATLYIMFEWFTDPEENLVFRSSHEFGAYTVEMLTPFTARNEVYNQLCKDSV
jgi:hypothetical protein